MGSEIFLGKYSGKQGIDQKPENEYHQHRQDYMTGGLYDEYGIYTETRKSISVF